MSRLLLDHPSPTSQTRQHVGEQAPSAEQGLPPKPADGAQFDQLRLRAHDAAAKAALEPGLTDVQRAQARAVVGLSGLILHRVYGPANADDYRAMIEDLYAIACIVDPLIEAIGAQAREHANIDMDLFRQQLYGAIDGNATFELESAAEEYFEQLRDDAAPTNFDAVRP